MAWTEYNGVVNEEFLYSIFRNEEIVEYSKTKDGYLIIWKKKEEDELHGDFIKIEYSGGSCWYAHYSIFEYKNIPQKFLTLLKKYNEEKVKSYIEEKNKEKNKFNFKEGQKLKVNNSQVLTFKKATSKRIYFFEGYCNKNDIKNIEIMD